MAQQSDTMGTVLKWGLIGAAAYFVYQAWASSQASSAAAAPAPGTAPAPVTTSTLATVAGGTAPPAPTTPVVAGTGSNPAATTTAQALVNAAGGETQLTADEWNYYWTQLSGVNQTADLFPAGNRAALMSVNDYIAARSAAGLPTTISGFSGLGVVALRVPLVFAYGADKRPLLVVPRP